jgi:hypothetical protein
MQVEGQVYTLTHAGGYPGRQTRRQVLLPERKTPPPSADASSTIGFEKDLMLALGCRAESRLLKEAGASRVHSEGPTESLPDEPRSLQTSRQSSLAGPVHAAAAVRQGS